MTVTVTIWLCEWEEQQSNTKTTSAARAKPPFGEMSGFGLVTLTYCALSFKDSVLFILLLHILGTVTS